MTIETEIQRSATEYDSSNATPTSGMFLVLRALRRVLRPLVKILLAHSVPIQQAIRLLKQVYVDAALEQLEHSGGWPSDSRLSVATGIHRREIRRLRENRLGDKRVPQSVSIGSQLVALWTTDGRFLDPRGNPLVLSRNIDVLGAPSFDELVMSVTKDIHPRTALDELRRIGVVRVGGDKRIHLLTAAFVPQKGFKEKIFYFERNLHDHLDVAARNLAAEEPPLLERSVHYRDLSPMAVEELSELASREGMKLLKKVNSRARTLRALNEDQMRTESAERVRLNFGLYFYRDPGTPVPSAKDDHAGGSDEA